MAWTLAAQFTVCFIICVSKFVYLRVDRLLAVTSLRVWPYWIITIANVSTDSSSGKSRDDTASNLQCLPLTRSQSFNSIDGWCVFSRNCPHTHFSERACCLSFYRFACLVCTQQSALTTHWSLGHLTLPLRSLIDYPFGHLVSWPTSLDDHLLCCPCGGHSKLYHDCIMSLIIIL